MANAISNLDDTIDSRDVIARIEELEAEESELQQELDETEDQYTPKELTENPAPVIVAKEALKNWQESEEGQELIALKALAEQGEDYAPDWEYGVQLIHEDYFEEAMDGMVANCYTLPEDLPSYLTITVDYDALKQDYTAIDFDGQTYYIR